MDRLIVAGVRFAAVLADAGYGMSAAIRQGLSTRGLAFNWEMNMAAIHVVKRIAYNQAHILRIARYIGIFLQFRTRSMIPLLNYCENLAVVAEAIGNQTLNEGAIIECGTWKGGMAAGLMRIGGPRRKYVFFDSFEGLPPVTELDGQSALSWQTNAKGPTFHNNNRSSLEEFKDTISKVNFNPDCYEIHKGWFSDTIPHYSAGPIAVLRLDGDWYESTMECMNGLWDHVMAGGIVIIDDYLTWDGCCRAIHDFLSRKKSDARIEVAPFGTCFIRKRT